MRRIVDSHIHIDKPSVVPSSGSFDLETLINSSLADPSKSLFTTDAKVVLQIMDSHGIEKAVVLQHPNAPFNKEVSDAVNAHPGRLRGAMILSLRDEECLKEMRLNADRGLTAIKLEMGLSALLYPGIKLDSERLVRVFDQAEQLRLTVVLDPHKIGSEGYQPERLNRVVGRFPDLKLVICHLGFPSPTMCDQPEKCGLWQQMASLATHENVWFDVSALYAMYGAVEDYPFPSAVRLVREFMTTYGATKVLWGSDCSPAGTFTYGTAENSKTGSYQQLIDMFADDSLFTDYEKHLLFYSNALTVFFDHPGGNTF